jgi:hypothetical protein
MADLNDGNLKDEAVASELVATLIPAARAIAGPEIRSIVVDAIRRERARLASWMERIAVAGERRGEPGARVARAMSLAARIPPGSCQTCGGLQQVPSALLGTGGQVRLAPCPACSPASAEASSPDDSTTSSASS